MELLNAMAILLGDLFLFSVRLYSKENETTSQQLLPHKHDIITLLSIGGHWITTEENLQVRMNILYSHC